MYDHLEAFDPNIRRKINGDSYDLEKWRRVQLKDPVRAAKFEMVRKDLRKRQGRDGDPAVLEYLIDMGWKKFEEEKLQGEQTLDQLSDTR